eukprot:gnl/MRDRNA2_/MRDRNA2_28022_c0_seq2.p1 gnl/MRDRNA2_/MRDRNA2_28022_c0~~gnl/MRDRNA2_/MRDRNA2_28022_c0_seq2.p1  ORF type:complete len:390 (-),score=98.10 gnl/MRDRNA2_/MRDRNA2_28022_c0_seq2:169-1338(-)
MVGSRQLQELRESKLLLEKQLASLTKTFHTKASEVNEIEVRLSGVRSRVESLQRSKDSAEAERRNLDAKILDTQLEARQLDHLRGRAISEARKNTDEAEARVATLQDICTLLRREDMEARRQRDYFRERVLHQTADRHTENKALEQNEGSMHLEAEFLARARIDAEHHNALLVDSLSAMGPLTGKQNAESERLASEACKQQRKNRELLAEVREINREVHQMRMNFERAAPYVDADISVHEAGRLQSEGPKAAARLKEIKDALAQEIEIVADTEACEEREIRLLEAELLETTNEVQERANKSSPTRPRKVAGSPKRWGPAIQASPQPCPQPAALHDLPDEVFIPEDTVRVPPPRPDTVPPPIFAKPQYLFQERSHPRSQAITSTIFCNLI